MYTGLYRWARQYYALYYFLLFEWKTFKNLNIVFIFNKITLSHQLSILTKFHNHESIEKSHERAIPKIGRNLYFTQQTYLTLIQNRVKFYVWLSEQLSSLSLFNLLHWQFQILILSNVLYIHICIRWYFSLGM